LFQAVAIHHPRPEHVEDFAAFMRRVTEAVGEPPGLIEFHSWREAEGGRLVGLSRWESQQAFVDALPQIMSLAHERRLEWSERPDELLLLEELS
jgi:quinol monooxygenase YgiN